MAEKIPPRELLHPVNFLALGFGSGLAPVAPGTAGTLVAIPVYLLLQPLALDQYLVLLAALFVAGIPICAFTAKRLDVHDHPGIVWDEIVGMYIVLIVTPLGLLPWILAFALFRAFDIVKPWPIRDLDHSLRGGAGIMLDDVLAAAYATLLITAGQHAIAAF